MAKFLVLIHETLDADPDHPEYARHWQFIEEHGDAILASQALQPPSTAVSLRHRADGTYEAADGPWRDAPEPLGGFYLLEAVDLPAAVELARQIPAPFGGLEIRPIMGMTPPA